MVAQRVSLAARDVAEFCRRNGIRKLSFFGSVLRDDFGPHSDLDVLVEFEPGATPGLIGIGRMERELAQLAGRKVDLRTPEHLSPYFRQDVLSTAEAQYVAA